MAAWPADPTFHPYYAVGDLNRDGVTDFALIVASATGSRRVIVFDGRRPTAAALTYELAATSTALFMNSFEPSAPRLLVGEFFSEADVAIEFDGRGYRVVASE